MFELTPNERQQQHFSANQVSEITDFLKENGYVVLQNVYDLDTIEKWHTALIDLLEKKRHKFFELMRQNNSQASGNNGPQRWSMHLPTNSVFFEEEVFANPLVLQIAENLMGENFVPIFISSEIAYPGTKSQVTHQDGASFALSLMVPLIDVEIENAPTEIWAKTHKPSPETPFDLGYYYVSDKACETYIKTHEGSLATLKRGDIILRDIRMLHRGTENVGNVPRPYLHILYYPIIHPIPPKFLTNLVVKPAKWLRNKIYPLEHTEKMILANYVGQIPELAAYSDRDMRRKLTAAQFAKLSPKAQHLLRLADREGYSHWKGNYWEGVKFLYRFGKTFLRTLF